jgi:hypothetical protein
LTRRDKSLFPSGLSQLDRHQHRDDGVMLGGMVATAVARRYFLIP